MRFYGKSGTAAIGQVLTGGRGAGSIARMQLPLVFLDGPWKLAMGLNALDPADWLWRDEHFAAETAAAPGGCWPTRPDEVHGHAARGRAGRARAGRHGRGAFWARPPAPDRGLAALAGLAQEDFCVMQARPDGAYALTAALLCFPAHWRLAEKLGRAHERDPCARARVRRPAGRRRRPVLHQPHGRAAGLAGELVGGREPVLFHPQPREPLPDLTAENAGEKLWLRIERQTLRRLPQSRAVVFTIRTLVRRSTEVVADPRVAGAMAARIREMEPGMAGYKGHALLREPLLAWLDPASSRAGSKVPPLGRAAPRRPGSGTAAERGSRRA